MTRYPEVRVRTRTPNPLLLVAKVRQEMRRAGLAAPADEAVRLLPEILGV